MKRAILLSSLVFVAVLVQAQPRYKVTDLGSIGGNWVTCAHGLNNNSEIAGVATTAGDLANDLFLWKNGKMSDLGTFGAGVMCVGNMPLNMKTEAIGNYLSNDGWGRAFLWREGTFADLGTLGGFWAGAGGINEGGQIVGFSALPDNSTFHSFLWQQGKMRDLHITLGGENSIANGINNAGMVSGDAETSAWTNRSSKQFHASHAYLWWKGSQVDLGTLGGELSAALAMNERGEVVGVGETNQPSNVAEWPAEHAFLWRMGRMTDLGTIGGDNASQPNQINNRGQVVGTSGVGLTMPGWALTVPYIGGNVPDCVFSLEGCYMPNHAFLWENGVMYDLDTLILKGSGWHFIAADAINDRGNIVAVGTHDGETGWRSVLLTPISK